MNRLFVPVAIAAVLSMAGCASTSSLPPAPAKATAAGTGAPAYSYVIGPGDTLTVNVWRHPELSVSVPVRPDGKVTLPLVEDMPASGRSPTDLGKDIEERLKKYVREPSVTVQVTNFVGNAGEQVRVVGQATKPAAIPYKQGMTLLDVMIQVGGITEYASGNRAVLIRQAEGNKQYSIRLRDLLKGGDVTANVELRPGDVIMIPESWF
ncbi:MAG: XrtA/PEP-CTERM system exopolysaccharide export protein [Burkholderiales bacterium]|jgi:polysaccharide export outer membrane protein